MLSSNPTTNTSKIHLYLAIFLPKMNWKLSETVFFKKKKKKQLYLDLGRKAEAIMSRSMPLGGDTRGGGI